MIGRLRGTLLQKHPPHLLLDVHGVGYELQSPMTTFYALPAEGAEVTLLTHLVVRDDAQLLYGFASEGERRLFRHLIRVNGIGARLALTILSGVTAEAFARCVRESDTATLSRLPGIGRKTAQRLVVEMRDRLAAEDDLNTPAAASTLGQPAEDAVSALIALGYKAVEATRMVRLVDGQGLTSEQIIRHALQRAV